MTPASKKLSQAHCPAYIASRKEGAVARGKIALAAALLEEIVRADGGRLTVFRTGAETPLATQRLQDGATIASDLWLHANPDREQIPSIRLPRAQRSIGLRKAALPQPW